MNRKALHSISYGLYIVSSMDGERINGQIANSVFQVTSEPQTIAVSINKENLTHSYIRASRTFSISILSRETPSTLIGRFGFRSGRDIDKFDGMKYKKGITGAPIALDYAIAYIEVDVTGEMDCGTHTIFFGNVVEADVLSSEEPLTYVYYQQVKKGKSPKTAPTYQKDEPPPNVEKAT